MDGVGTERAGEDARPTGRWARLSRSHARTALVAVLGAAAGGAYAHFVGCRTGTCPLTSSVWTSSVYGALVGGIIGWPARER